MFTVTKHTWGAPIPLDTVYVGRGPRGCHMLNTSIGEKGWLGNPYLENVNGFTREEVIHRFSTAFYNRLMKDDIFREAVLALDNGTYKYLACWCTPLPCHAQVIADYLNEQRSRKDIEHDAIICDILGN